MPIFPSSLSSINYEPRDSFFQANKREFRMMKQQDNNNDDYTTPAKPLPVKTASTKLTADAVIPELEKEIGQAESFMIEIDEIITEWDAVHGQQYVDAVVPFRAKTAYQPEPYAFVPSHAFAFPPFQPSRERIQAVASANGTPGKFTEKKKAYDAFVAGEKAAYDIAEANAEADYNDEMDAEEVIYNAAHAVRQTQREALHDADENAAEAQYLLNPLTALRSKNATSNRFFNQLPPLAQRLLTTTAKTLTIINNIKIIYKSKISGNKLNRFDKTDMIKIQALFDKFLNICKEVAENMKQQRRVIIDVRILKKMFLNINGNDDPAVAAPDLDAASHEFHHAYDKGEQKFIKLINEIDTLYVADKQRYSYNLGKY